MTYLYQLHTHFTGHELEVQQIGKTADESNYVIGRFATDRESDVSSQLFGREINNLRRNRELLVSENITVAKNLSSQNLLTLICIFQPKKQNSDPISQDFNVLNDKKASLNLKLKLPNFELKSESTKQNKDGTENKSDLKEGRRNSKDEKDNNEMEDLNATSEKKIDFNEKKLDVKDKKVNVSEMKIDFMKNNSDLNKSVEGKDDIKDKKEPKSPSSVKDVKDAILTGSKIIGKVLAPSKEGLTQNGPKEESKNEKTVLMTRRELCDPFGSDDEEVETPNAENQNKTIKASPTNGIIADKNKLDAKSPELPKPNPVIFLIFIS